MCQRELWTCRWDLNVGWKLTVTPTWAKKKKSKNPYEGEDTSWGDTKGRGLRVAVFRVGPFQLRILHSVLFLWSQICWCEKVFAVSRRFSTWFIHLNMERKIVQERIESMNKRYLSPVLWCSTRFTKSLGLREGDGGLQKCSLCSE